MTGILPEWKMTKSFLSFFLIIVIIVAQIMQLLNNIINRESEFLRSQILSDSAAVTSSECR